MKWGLNKIGRTRPLSLKRASDGDQIREGAGISAVANQRERGGAILSKTAIRTFSFKQPGDVERTSTGKDERTERRKRSARALPPGPLKWGPGSGKHRSMQHQKLESTCT